MTTAGATNDAPDSLTTVSAPPRRAASPLRAAIFMIGAIACFSMMAVAGRELGGRLTTFQIMFWRSLVGLVIVGLLVALSRDGFAQLRSARPGAHLVKHGRRPSYRLKDRTARKPAGLRDSREAQKSVATYTQKDDDEAMHRRFRRQDEARYRVKDKAAKFKPAKDRTAPSD